MEEKKKTLFIDGKEVAINGERNLLEVIRKAGVEIPTFCYHSELSIYGACRLCIVDVEGMGIVGSCSTQASPGMKVRTNTSEIREMRKITLELLLANHEQKCPTCVKNADCQLQRLAKKVGVDEVRFKQVHVPKPVDRSSVSLVRDPNKCVLCGDCVRMCQEVQGIGAIDFAYRGSNVMVLPAFGKDFCEVECVNCGQCARVCPTGALTPALEIEKVWDALYDKTKTVVVQIAPAVRVALGEMFGMKAEPVTGKIIAALKRLGFDKVYDTSFTADLTVVEEANEFIDRKVKGEKLPQFTSCCPAWVKFAEQYYPELLPNISSCRSPQQMFGSLAKQMLPEMIGIRKEDLVVVSVMPCTAKKFEAKRPEFTKDDIADVDHVLTTQELGRMIDEAGLDFVSLEPESFDMPLGFKTGAGVIFGVSGGVSEAVLRYAVEKLSGKPLENADFKEIRGLDGVREASYTVAGVNVKLAVVHSLSNARAIAEKAKKGECDYDLIEVMACPGGCIGGAGQPCGFNKENVKEKRAKGLYEIDKSLELHKSQENPYVKELYNSVLKDHTVAHEMLHTEYSNRKRITDEGMLISEGGAKGKLLVNVCLGTSCYLRGAQDLIHELIVYIEEKGLSEKIDVRGSFCFEQCENGPTVRIGENVIEGCTFAKVKEELDNKFVKVK